MGKIKDDWKAYKRRILGKPRPYKLPHILQDSGFDSFILGLDSVVDNLEEEIKELKYKIRQLEILS